jgi:hypothetical protein
MGVLDGLGRAHTTICPALIPSCARARLRSKTMSAEEKKTEIQAMKDHEERHAKRVIATRNALDQRMSKVPPILHPVLLSG